MRISDWSSDVCSSDLDVSWGVRTQGFELEASLVPARSFRMTAGVTYARTKYRDNLVGDSSGAPLDQALRKLPGDNMSNAPELVATGSIAWTPDIGSGGMTGPVYLDRSEEHTSELQSPMSISYAVFCL